MSTPSSFLSAPSDDQPHLPDWPVFLRDVLTDAHATDELGRRLAEVLQKGDTILLSGHLGSGKTHLARALIRARLGDNEAVPSPTFTLVQTYPDPSGTDLWHCDLYRLGDPGELSELGLREAMDDAICLIEWPDRLDPDWPSDAVLLHLEIADNNARQMSLRARHGSSLGERLAEALGQ